MVFLGRVFFVIVNMKNPAAMPITQVHRAHAFIVKKAQARKKRLFPKCHLFGLSVASVRARRSEKEKIYRGIIWREEEKAGSRLRSHH